MASTTISVSRSDDVSTPVFTWLDFAHSISAVSISASVPAADDISMLILEGARYYQWPLDGVQRPYAVFFRWYMH